MQTAHRIQRLIIRAQAPTEPEALAVNQALKTVWPTLIDTFNSHFDSLADEHKLLRIPRLQIHLSFKDLTFKDLRTLNHQLNDSLQTALQQEMEFLKRSTESVFSFPESTPNVHSGPSSTNYSQYELDKDQIDFEWIMAYLHTGHAPWYLRDLTDLAIRVREYVQKDSEKVLKRLVQRPTPPSIRRWLLLYESQQLETAIHYFLTQLNLLAAEETPWKIILQAVASQKVASTSSTQRYSLIADMLCQLALAPSNGPTNNSESSQDTPSISPTQWQQWQSVFAHASTVTNEQALNELLDTFIKSRYVQINNQESACDVVTPPYQAGCSSQTSTSSDLTSFAVQYAGLVLLYPYLPRLFDACGIGYSKAGINPQDIQRAAALLVYAATGDDAPLDFELAFISFLLGLPAYEASDDAGETLFVAPGLINIDEKSEVDALLTAFIGHWSRLKNTSIHGLRVTFLQRSGWLRREANQDYLHLERIGPDVLIDFLPFTLSMVKLPWMPTPLHTVW